MVYESEKRGGHGSGGRNPIYGENMVHTNVSLIPSQFAWLGSSDGKTPSERFRALLEEYLKQPYDLVADPVASYTQDNRPEIVRSRSFHVRTKTKADLQLHLEKSGARKNPLLRQIIQTAMEMAK